VGGIRAAQGFRGTTCLKKEAEPSSDDKAAEKPATADQDDCAKHNEQRADRCSAATSTESREHAEILTQRIGINQRPLRQCVEVKW
jgi:hypothetical protein